MNVIIRGIMAAALGVYASLHVQQAFADQTGSPGWLTAAFVVTAIAAIALAVALIAVPERLADKVIAAGAALAGGSLVALVLSYTVGFLGVTQAEVRIETAIVFVAELLALGIAALDWRFRGTDAYDEVTSSSTRSTNALGV